MKFGYAWTSGEAPAPPEKRTPALPRPPACLQNSNWAASPQRACFCLLGASEFGSDFLNGGFRPIGCLRVRGNEPQNAQTSAANPSLLTLLRLPFECDAAGGYANALAEMPAPPKTAHQELDVKAGAAGIDAQPASTATVPAFTGPTAPEAS